MIAWYMFSDPTEFGKSQTPYLIMVRVLSGLFVGWLAREMVSGSSVFRDYQIFLG